MLKTQKNGNKHQYTYYHCGKKKDESCNQKSQPINEAILEKQIINTIDKIDIPKDIFTWVIHELDREKQEDKNNQKEIIKNYQKQLYKEQSRMSGLIDMRADNEISKKHYAEKKKIIENNINHYQSLIDKLENGKAEQKQKTIKYFEFATNLKEKFKNGSPKTKKAITLNLGSNLSIKDRKAHFCLDFPLQPFEKYAPKVKEELAMVQTSQKGLNKAQNTSLQGACSVGWT